MQMLPEEIIKRKEVIDLYKWGIWLIGGILGTIVLGVLVLAGLGAQVPDWLNAIGVVLATALASLIGKENRNE